MVIHSRDSERTPGWSGYPSRITVESTRTNTEG